MAILGVPLDNNQMVLTRRRDFKWAFMNLDENNDPEQFPGGSMYFELETGNEANARQQVEVKAASGGVYRFIYDGHMTPDIDYYDVSQAPQAMAGDIQDALEALPNIAPGEVVVHPAQLYPIWEIKFTVNAARNEIQNISFSGMSGNTGPVPTGGNFRLTYKNKTTPNITYPATPTVVQTALQALPTIGTGNVLVTSDGFGGFNVEFIGTLTGTNVDQIVGQAQGNGFGLIPKAGWFVPKNKVANIYVKTVVGGVAKLSEQLVNTLNLTVNDYYDQFEDLLGVDITYRVEDTQNITLIVKSQRPYTESALLTYQVDVKGNALEQSFNATVGYDETFQSVVLDFYWNHVYEIEFIGAKGLSEQPTLLVDVSDLEGAFNEQDVEVTVLERGKGRLTKWPFVIDGALATLSVESEEADLISDRTPWQLVFLPTGEAEGGDALARGTVRVQQ
jgi:hypothetical protein